MTEEHSIQQRSSRRDVLRATGAWAAVTTGALTSTLPAPRSRPPRPRPG
ncbi:hypothetical protein PV396_09480 [Streptomyces sp. ME02-8801-2C]|nr:hypothetical protein [Streptomyces sp. ME02-8801-2C]MDX3452167.1 hypothetical protein [Streptomyces sp. ME02-8801-2C]